MFDFLPLYVLYHSLVATVLSATAMTEIFATVARPPSTSTPPSLLWLLGFPGDKKFAKALLLFLPGISHAKEF